MKKTETSIDGAYVIQVEKFDDGRGFFMETFNHKQFQEEVGDFNFVQDNHSLSTEGVLRGLHYQIKHPQGKLVRCTRGEIFDAIVDLRVNSPTYKKNFTFKLNRPDLMMWVPPGLAHGFYAVSEKVEFQYKVTDYYDPRYDRTLKWDDKDLGIMWPFYEHWGYSEPVLSEKDKKGLSFKDCEKYE
jgi:dTDP-4-dehydrorhamnose 3,5-epimerase